jgi:hypothetical protein
MKLLLVLAAVVALASCQKEEMEPIVRRNVIICGADTVVIETAWTSNNFITSTSVSKCRSSKGYGDTIEISQFNDFYDGYAEGYFDACKRHDSLTHVYAHSRNKEYMLREYWESIRPINPMTGEIKSFSEWKELNGY